MDVRNRSLGFSLIELMVVLAIIAMLTSMAYYYNRSSITKTYRAEALRGLSSNAKLLLDNYGRCGAYLTGDQCNTPITIDKLPQRQVVTTSNTVRYVFAINIAANKQAYNLYAIPTEDSGQSGDECGTFSVNNFGEYRTSAFSVKDGGGKTAIPPDAGFNAAANRPVSCIP